MSVVDGSPAADAGFKKGDVITTFDGRSISNAKGLKETLTYYAAGETVDVTVQRADNGEYKEVTLTLTLGSAADMPQTSGSSNGIKTRNNYFLREKRRTAQEYERLAVRLFLHFLI